MKDFPTCFNCKSVKKVTLKYLLSDSFRVYFCKDCQIGFTYPVPKNLSEYYHFNYWETLGFMGELKKIVFKLFQQRRKKWLQKYLTKGSVLEIGAGEGEFIDSLGGGYKCIGIEFPNAQIKNKKILKTDFLRWKTNKKFDAVIFWESLEHLQEPQRFLNKANKLLNNKGLVFIEVPRFDCLESLIFGKYWSHLDIPRHLTHFTDLGLKKMLTNNEFKVIQLKKVPAFEYTVWGFSDSILNFFGIKLTDYLKKSVLPPLFIVFLPVLMVALTLETILLFMKQSPINLVIAKKND